MWFGRSTDGFLIQSHCGPILSGAGLKAVNLDGEDHRERPARVFVSTSHCSAGCTIGDALGVPIVALIGMAIIGSTLPIIWSSLS